MPADRADRSFSPREGSNAPTGAGREDTLGGQRRDAVVVGAGPNGLAAAILLADHGLDVLLIEASGEVGGGLRSEQSTLPGFEHDVCSAVHPLGFASPFFSTLDLGGHGLEWVHSSAPLAHSLTPDRVVMMERSVEDTARALGDDADAYRTLIEPLVEGWDGLAADLLAPLHLPRHPLRMARFGRHALRSAEGLVTARFRTEEARALLAGCAAHSFLPLDRAASAAVGLVLAVAAHSGGWPIPRGGSGRFAEALEGAARSRGVEIRTGWNVRDLAELPQARATLLDVTPSQLLALGGERLPDRYARKLREYRYGPGAFKMDWALDGRVPWAAEDTGRAATVHLGGPLEAIVESEAAPWRGEVSDRPFVLFVQPTRFDPSRSPAGGHTAWAYCHVPNGWDGDASRAIEDRIEEFAPGFRERVLQRRVRTPADLERANPNLVGGDINGGVQDLGQLLTRPVARLDPYSTPVDGLFLCSSSTPPGGGVHGMCGYHAARSALRNAFGISPRA